MQDPEFGGVWGGLGVCGRDLRAWPWQPQIAHLDHAHLATAIYRRSPKTGTFLSGNFGANQIKMLLDFSWGHPLGGSIVVLPWVGLGCLGGAVFGLCVCVEREAGQGGLGL